jgi:hypothetical protein
VHKVAENMKWGNIKLELTLSTSVTLISTFALPSHLKVNSLQYAIILKCFPVFIISLIAKLVTFVSRPVLFQTNSFFPALCR